VRRPQAEHRREDSLKPSWQAQFEQVVISIAENPVAKTAPAAYLW